MFTNSLRLVKRFGTLAELSKKNIGKAIDYYNALSVQNKVEHADDFSIFASELLRHQGTSLYLTDLKNLSVFETKVPIKISENSVKSLSTMIDQALRHKNMLDLDVAVHLAWHNSSHIKFPYKKVTNI